MKSTIIQVGGDDKERAGRDSKIADEGDFKMGDKRFSFSLRYAKNLSNTLLLLFY
jgi:hypothetical protein